MISFIMSCFVMVSQMVTNFLHTDNPKPHPQIIVVKKTQQNSSSPLTTSSVVLPTPNQKIQVKQSMATESKNVEHSPEVDAAMSEYDNYAHNISVLKRNIELNRLKAEAYKSQISYEEDVFGQTVVIGVIIDRSGYKSATLRMSTGTVVQVVKGSRIGKYTVSKIELNEVDLIDKKCKVTKKSNDEIINPKDLINNPFCTRMLKLRPIYRNVDNQLPPSNKVTNPDVSPNNNPGTDTHFPLNIPPIVTGK